MRHRTSIRSFFWATSTDDASRKSRVTRPATCISQSQGHHPARNLDVRASRQLPLSANTRPVQSVSGLDP